MTVAPAGALSSGDRLWAEAGTSTLAELVSEVRQRAKAIHGTFDADAVHDMRTATRRLRTALEVFGAGASKRDRKPVERELQRVARRLGEVRDLDVLIEALGSTPELHPVRTAWNRARDAGAKRLQREVDRPRFDRALASAGTAGTFGLTDHADAGREGIVLRVANRAPAMIWAAFGELLAHELDPMTADPPVIHELRKDAKRLRYTLEAFEDALQPGAHLIVLLVALQDAGGEMHDAIVARDKARATMDSLQLQGREADAIEAFAAVQDGRAEACRPVVDRTLGTVRSRAFRESLSRALAGMGHVDPGR
jgi:CHAD domain-containing protein